MLLCSEDYYNIEEMKEVIQLATVKVHNRTNKKYGAGSSSSSINSKLSSASASSSPVLQELGTNQVKQILRTAGAVATFGHVDGRVFEMFFTLFEDSKVPISLIVGEKYLSRILQGRRTSKKDSSAVNNGERIQLDTPSSLESILFFHALRDFCRSSDGLPRNLAAAERVAYVVQMTSQALVRVFKAITPTIQGNVMTIMNPYLCFEQHTGIFRVLTNRAEGFGPVSQQTTLDDVSPTNDSDKVDKLAWSRSLQLDSALRSVISICVDHLHRLIRSNHLFQATPSNLNMSDNIRLLKIPSDSDTALPLLFRKVKDEHLNALGLQAPQGELSTPTANMPPVIDLTQKEKNAKRNHSPSEERSANKRTRTHGSGSAKNSSPVVKKEPTEVDHLLERNDTGDDDEHKTQMDEAFFKLREEMLTTFSCYDVGFDELGGSHEDQCGVQLDGTVDLLLTDPPFNTRRQNKSRNSTHDNLRYVHMEKVASIAGRFLKPGGHGVIFCSDLQFADWYKVLTSVMAEESNGSEGPSSRSSTTTMFVVEKKSLCFLRKPGYYNNGPKRHPNVHVNMQEMAIHFWKRGGSSSSAARTVNYHHTTLTGSIYPSWTNVMTNIPRPTNEETIYAREEDIQPDTDGREEGEWDGGDDDPAGPSGEVKKLMLRPEQKADIWLMDLVAKFSPVGGRVVDLFAGTYSVARACMKLPQHRQYIGCDIDENCFGYAEESLVETFARQLLNPKSDIITDKEVIKFEAQKYVSEVERKKIRQRVSVWEVPPGLQPVQTLPPHILKYIGTFHQSTAFAKAVERTTPNLWSNQWFQRLNAMDVAALRTVECMTHNLCIKQSTINHVDAGYGLFATENFDLGDTIGFYYGSLVYGNLASNRRLNKLYGEGILAVSSKQFKKFAAELTHPFTASDGSKYTGWIAPAPWCAMRYINDPRTLPTSKHSNTANSPTPTPTSTPTSTTNNSDQSLRTANVKFHIKKKMSLNKHFQYYDALSIVCIKKIKKGSELFLDYGSEYEF